MSTKLLTAEMKRWFPSLKGCTMSNPVAYVILFHGAGSDPQMFLARGKPGKPQKNVFVEFCEDNRVELLIPHLPGRTVRYTEERLVDAGDVANQTLQVLQRERSMNKKFRLFADNDPVPLIVGGHSMGAICAYEFCCALRANNLVLPKHLWLSCSISPDVPESQWPWIKACHLPEERFKEECRGWSINEKVFSPAAWDMYQGILRDDFHIFETYDFVSRKAMVEQSKPGYYRPLGIPMTAFYATADPRVPPSLINGWASLVVGEHNIIKAEDKENDSSCVGETESNFRLIGIKGTHNYFLDDDARNAWGEHATQTVDRILIEAEYGC